MTVEIFVFCGWRFLNQTHFSCDTVGREMWLTILSSPLCPKTDRNIRIGKQGYVFICMSTVILTLGKVEFFFK